MRDWKAPQKYILIQRPFPNLKEGYMGYELCIKDLYGSLSTYDSICPDVADYKRCKLSCESVALMDTNERNREFDIPPSYVIVKNKEDVIEWLHKNFDVTNLTPGMVFNGVWHGYVS